MARLGCAFRPVYGGHQWRSFTGAAENFVMHTQGNDTWLAAINYDDQTLSVSIPLDDLGLSDNPGMCVRELWTRKDVVINGAVLPVNVPPRDARIFHFSLVQSTLSE